MSPALITALLVAGGAAEADGAALDAETRRAYATVLSRHVKDGRVDYRGIEKKSLKLLDGYLSKVAEADLPEGRNARIGFLADAYNALVLRSVIRHGRPRSVLDVKGFFNEEKHRVAGRDVTLDALEKKVLNPFAKDPRTHFILVCAAVGCPILEGRPFAGTDLDARMEKATRRYLAGTTGARRSGSQLLVSKIFDWYAADFGGKDGVKDFILPRLSGKTREGLGQKPDIGYIDYNWTLNQM
ncbi:MAG: DUF547 domain-containing protein [Myxococcota bacterium]